MPSCLGLYTDKNMIKYAKVTSTSDKTSSNYSVEAYGVKFYDNIQTTVSEIASEVGMEQGPIALALSNENYYMTHIFSNLKKKDMTDLIIAEYMTKNGNSASTSVTEVRYKLAQNIGMLDKSLAICVVASKGELANINQNYENYKISSISAMPISIKNLFVNEGIDEESIVVNIEDKTTITVFKRSEIQHAESIPLGAQEIISKLAEKYNSYQKAYEACKKVSAYLDDTTEMDEESREILDAVIPVIYDIRQQVETIAEPYSKDLKKLYITGTGAIINNIDLYFQEVFPDFTCEILTPFFLRRDTTDVKEIIEVNSAIALALDGLGMASQDLDFNVAAKKAAGTASVKETLKKLKIEEKFKEFQEKAKEFIAKLNAPARPKKKRGKVKVDFDDGIVSKPLDGEEDEKVGIAGFGMIDIWLQRLAVLTLTLLITYSLASYFVNESIKKKDTEVQTQIAKTEAVIATAKDDAEYLLSLANDYVEITNKLSYILEKINDEQLQSSFNIPNFLSKLMFIMPSSVQITSINVNSSGNVEIDAESGQYAQLGYFVSRIKLEQILLNVDMEVLSVNSNIKILVSGVLP